MSEAAREAALAADDDAARERALNIGRSFLVQAPAGSGKTELLIQRYLALLAHVERPEQIVAVTFTRKAAGEMRERIVAALLDADTGTPAKSAHAARTRRLAHAALAQSTRHGWQLLAHPSRLAVYTIDTLVAALARQAPVTTGLGGAPRYEERATPLYTQAVRAALADAPADDSGWRRLLAHLDNDADTVVGLLAEMLAQREQWIGILGEAKREGFRASLEAALAAEVVGEIGEAASLFPSTLLPALAARERDAAANLAQSPETAELAGHLAACAAHGGLPPASVEALPRWRALGGWLLVGGKARFRLEVGAKGGFPAIGAGGGSSARRQSKTAMHDLLETLTNVPDLAEALHWVRRLPHPRYADDAWAIVEALLEILPRAGAHLLVTFREAGVIDFTQGTLGALTALGDDAPTDLLLKLDFQLRHLLIDEFQDTSFTQIELIRRLTAGWQPDDGRTLFAVGDPMQSIYRFRGAEVRLFVEAQQSGRIAELPVENLVLRRNFRSQAGLVEWTNAVFADVLGQHSDPWRGKVAFTASVAACDALPGVAASIDIAADAEAEARAIVRHVRAALAEGSEHVAVLVRARAHLDPLVAILREEGIAFAVVEQDLLIERQSILDLASLTHALLQPADRLAWLAVLRAPWCGMTLADLFAVASSASAQRAGSIAAAVESREPMPDLTCDGQARFARVAEVLAAALASRGRAGIAARVRGAWLALGGPATLCEAIDFDAAERFFDLLAKHEAAGDVPEWPAFVEALRTLYVAPELTETAQIQLMTLHRAKGLEFDTVVLPGLAREPRRNDPEILRWRRRPQGLLLAPTKGQRAGDDPIYTYLGLIDTDEESAELGRLLYVGCTRAKRRLHLTAVLGVRDNADAVQEWAPPPAGSAFAKCWRASGVRSGAPGAPAEAAQRASPARLLARVPAEWKPPQPAAGVPVVAPPDPLVESIPFDWARETARHVGTVAHRLFAQIARDGLAAWNPARVVALGARVRTELSVQGVDEAQLADAAETVVASVTALLTDERGRWLLDSGHTDARSEWALAGVEGGAIAHLVIDRSFVANGTRWIVDFKTGTHEGADLDVFIDREVARYRGQLERYARFVRVCDARPIRIGLYFPLQRAWREWPYDDRSQVG